MDEMESDSERSNVSLDEDFSLEAQGTVSSSKFKHQYPDDPVFVHDEDLEKEDDMAYFASICTLNTKPALVKNVFAMLLNFACCKVFESIKSNVARTDKKTLWLTCCNEMRAFVTNYPATKEARDVVLKDFPEKTWPAGFADYVQKQLWKEPNKKVLKSLPDYNKLTDTEKRACMFGSAVEDQAVRKASAEINNFLNPKWQKLPSGNNNYTSLYRYLRRCLWHDIALTKATNNMKNRLQANAKNPVVLTDAFTKEHFLERLYLAALKSLEEDWGYPLCWISFLQMGLPALASHGHISPLFNSGIPTVGMGEGLGPLEAAQGFGSKSARKQFHESLQGKRPPPAKDSGGRKKNRYQSPTTSTSPSPISGDMSKLHLACSTMEKEIKLMEDLGMTEEVIREMKLKLLRHYQKLRQHTTESLQVVDLCDEDLTEDCGEPIEFFAEL
jgi:hypothetical protein